MGRLYEQYYLPHVNRDFWKDYIRLPDAPQDHVGRPWTSMPNHDLDRLAHRAMLEYYFRPVQLYRAVRSVRSVGQFWRYARAGTDMLLHYLVRPSVQS